MGKKSHKKSQAVAALESTTAPLLELKYDAPLFALAAHPTKPIIASGLANGYVFLTEYDPAKLSIYQYDTKSKIESLSKEERKKLDKKNQKFWKVYMISKNTEDDENSGVKQLWKTKRHKGSVRSICFNAEGDEIYTVGSDNVIKRADSLTGKVIKKCEIDSKVAITKILKSQTHPIIITGDEVGNVRVFNLDLKQTNILQNVHEDAINDIVQLVHKSAYQFLSVGSTTLAVWDVRKEKANLTSENQEDEMLSCGFVDPTKGDTLICGMGEGIVTIWKHEKNHFSDQLSRVKVAKDESIDSVISTLQNDDCIWCGSSDGVVSKVNAKRGQVLETRVHSSIDEVSFLEIDYEYRLISAGMDKLKLWNNDEEEDDEEDEEEDFSDSSDDGDDDSDEGEDDEFNGFSDKEEKNEEDEDSDAWEDLGPASESEEKEEEEEEAPKPKQSKKHKEKKEEDDEDEAPVSKKNKKQKLSTKQLRNLQKHEHGIRRFDDL
ncbi:unnamed protein product [Wickerhamomyces anomalus]